MESKLFRIFLAIGASSLIHSAAEIFDVLFMAMNLMSRLEHLTIRFNSFTMPERISLLTFPQLLSCRLTFGRTIDTDGSMIASFLTRHPTLKCVRTDCHSSQISLPNLQSFEGYADYAPILAQGITRGLKSGSDDLAQWQTAAGRQHRRGGIGLFDKSHPTLCLLPQIRFERIFDCPGVCIEAHTAHKEP
ncbi:hypothetical protein B0H14DRAFT_1120263 [Mycena olivaceomarginata]|nr:hypothetical protein B0H14DRAFT_1120263 [Mycena olivaceomarginata]